MYFARCILETLECKKKEKEKRENRLYSIDYVLTNV